MKKKNSLIKNISRKDIIILWVSIVLFILMSAIFLLVTQTEFSIPPFIDNNRFLFTTITFILMIGAAVLMTFTFLSLKRLSNSIRFNYATFALVKNIKSERLFLEAVKKSLAKEEHENCVVITFTVSKFKKTVFTRYGYEKGAEILNIVYDSFNPLQKEYPQSTFGYDYNENFLIFLTKADSDSITNYINKLTKVINEKLIASKNEVKFTSDFGLSYAKNENGELLTGQAMLQRALIAAEHGRNDSEMGSVTTYDTKMFEKNKRNVQLGVEIERGLDLDQFVLHYQPKFDLKLKRFVGAEALVRWHHPELGLLSPANFILFSEQSDLIIKLDHYVVSKVCEQLNIWRGRGERLMPISVNISKRTLFTGNIVNHIIKETEKYNINPMLLEIEIVESPSLQDILLLLSIVRKFKALKIKIAIDDFGTGYSSLSYIKKIPFDVIKIDKAFLDDVDIDQKSRLVIKNIIDLAHILDAYVVIEGVQDEKQVKMLETMGSDAIQGFFYARPLPAFDYQTFLEDNLFEMNAKKKGGKK